MRSWFFSEQPSSSEKDAPLAKTTPSQDHPTPQTLLTKLVDPISGRDLSFVLPQGQPISPSLLQMQPDFQRSLLSLPKNFAPSRSPRVYFHDPMTLLSATGYRDRRFSLSYDVMRRVSYQLSLIGAIILTRANQVASFSKPYRENKQIGFQIRFKNSSHIPTEQEKLYLTALENFIVNCGWEKNPYTKEPRDGFGDFLKKVTRDSKTYDQMCFEIVPDQDGRPFEFRAVDAASIRIASTFDGYRGQRPRAFKPSEFGSNMAEKYREDVQLEEEGVRYVQVYQGRIIAVFSEDDLAFCIRNPRSDLWTNGYGFGEIEMGLNIITRMLWAEEYNARNFKQGPMINGILNAKGEDIDPNHLESFKREWQANVAGVENSWKIPMMQIPDGVEFINLGRNNREMEYRQWLEYLIKVISGIFQIDPSEVNFDLVQGGGGGGAGPMFESKHEWKIKHSKDKGLRPLLSFVSEKINRYIIDPLDDRLFFDFIGLDQMTETERIELLTKRTNTYLTINEARKEEGRDPLPGGDIVNSPTFFQAYQAESANPALKPYSHPLAPWRKQGEGLDPQTGLTEPIPLYLQEGGEEEPPQGGAEGPPGAGGPPGMPPLG